MQYREETGRGLVGHMEQSPQEQVAAFYRNVEKAEVDMGRLELMQEEIRAIQVVETSPDRSVTVVAGPSGSLRSIEFAESAMTMRPQALSRLVTITFQQSMAKSARQMAEIVQRYVGDRTDILDKVNKLQAELANPPTPHDGFELHRVNTDAVRETVLTPAPPPPPPPPAPMTGPSHAPAPHRAAPDGDEEEVSRQFLANVDGGASAAEPPRQQADPRSDDADNFRFRGESY